MLAVVDEEQQLLVAQELEQHGQRTRRGLVAQVEGGHERAADRRWIPNLAEFDQPGAVRKTACQVGRDPDRTACLAHSARPDQADQPRLAELLAQLGDLPAPADEARRLGWQIALPARSPSHVAHESTTCLLYTSDAADE